MINLKTPSEIEKIKEAGKVVGLILKRIEEIVAPGVKTKELEQIAYEVLKEFGARSAFKGYKPNGAKKPFPALICTSVNNEVVHGIPGDRVLNEGDIVSVDVGVELGGYYADGAATFAVGRVTHEVARLIDVTRKALLSGILQARVGNTLVDVARGIEKVVVEAGFSVVRELVGHGVGRNLHEEPPVPNFVDAAPHIPLREGMVLAIEPMVNMGSFKVRVLDDGWTVVTDDGYPSAHFEHSVAITNVEPLVLTKV